MTNYQELFNKAIIHPYCVKYNYSSKLDERISPIRLRDFKNHDMPSNNKPNLVYIIYRDMYILEINIKSVGTVSGQMIQKHDDDIIEFSIKWDEISSDDMYFQDLHNILLEYQTYGHVDPEAIIITL